MIKRLKIKFVILSVASLFALLLVIVTGMNVINYNSILKESDDILYLLSQNHGAFPDEPGKKKKLPPDMSPELPYESRYFSVLLNQTGDIIYTETSRIISVDTSMAISYADAVTESGTNRGFIDQFRFVLTSEGDTTRITFLDCGRKLDTYHSFLFSSICMALTGFVIVSIIIFFFAGKFIRPIAESYEKQKRFITDAGHEIKTPLTIINANADVLEMDIGENECLEDIRQQAKRLTTLTNDLVYLARMEESENRLQMIEFPVSEIVQETAMSFKTPVQAQEKKFTCEVQPMLSMRGNDKAIRQLVSILMDNALKYSPAGGSILLRFIKQNKTLFLTVYNTTETAIDSMNLDHVFDRFYRLDPSRNSRTGGHGIGLSVAKAITAAHGGKIKADTKDGHSFQITVAFTL